MSRKGNRIEIPCALGTLVAEVAGDPGVYDEIEIDLVRPDGMLMQLCVAGTGPSSRPPYEGNDLHVYVWDGTDDCPTVSVYPSMEHEYWYPDDFGRG